MPIRPYRTTNASQVSLHRSSFAYQVRSRGGRVIVVAKLRPLPLASQTKTAPFASPESGGLPMQSENNSRHVYRERKWTDESLKNERTKTDESLRDERETQEQRTDAAISTFRSAADSERSKSRVEEDAVRKHQQAKPEASVACERARADENINVERQRADSAIKVERTRADAAFRQERSNRRWVEKNLLDQERSETDRNLSHERDQTDISIQTASRSLTDEQASHAKTKSALTSRDEFLAIVSHDLRNPIGAISSCAEMLLEHPLNGPLNKETQTWLEFIKRNADNALRLTSDLLDVERISADKLELQLGQHDMAKIMRYAAEQFTSLAAAKSILLRPVAPHVSCLVTCDPDRIMQVLSNLIGNAVKFTPENGSVTLKLDVLEDGYVEVAIIDNGPGIPDDRKAAIFERFSQLGNKDRRGLGLGLYISMKIIEAHRGRLWVESTLGEGSRFTFTLPKETYH